ncbi:hypothetical protein BD626DRAFT_197069 [Schizophyllum amplum]|uniref:Uncharacterized protein n=1 Tax=Schizophyllum amplum TaxID=97359 RepID=A0A550CMT3_9AGAR|nr:hypothetical protein BD626DRAFT_197069 [Auriculariopsis ampla]
MAQIAQVKLEDFARFPTLRLRTDRRWGYRKRLRGMDKQVMTHRYTPHTYDIPGPVCFTSLYNIHHAYSGATTGGQYTEALARLLEVPARPRHSVLGPIDHDMRRTRCPSLSSVIELLAEERRSRAVRRSKFTPDYAGSCAWPLVCPPRRFLGLNHAGPPANRLSLSIVLESVMGRRSILARRELCWIYCPSKF